MAAQTVPARVSIQQQDFDLSTEVAALCAGDSGVGAVASFIGTVRERGSDHGDGDRDRVSAMELEHYPGMTEQALEEIDAQARQRWPLDASLIVHRYGKVQPGDDIVLVITASAHREAAFEACHFLIDWLKTKAPFWKLEENSEGADWVAAKDSDDASAARWEKPPQ